MIRVVIMGAGARGNRVFADLIARHNTGFSLAGVVEPLDPRREAFREEYGIPETHAFATAEAFLAAPKIGDVVFICTPDPTHYELCKAVSEKGYDAVIEKPIATNLPDCFGLLDVEQSTHTRIIVAHVLRYSAFFRKVKDIVQSGELGAIRNISLSENVGHWHYAHSYVRGNWRRSDTSAPIILTKSCHDLDIIYWLMGERVTSVSSVGSLTYFQPNRAPLGATERCVDCPHKDSCLYSATRFYINDKTGWPYDVVAPYENSTAAREEAIATGPYGRCVYLNDNDVCDNQVVTLEFASGALATLGLHAQTADNTRKLTILFDKGELVGDLKNDELYISHFTGERDAIRIEHVSVPAYGDSHGGGDLQLLVVLYEHFVHGKHKELVTSLHSSIASHILAFLAEESRTTGGGRVPVPEILTRRPATDPHIPRRGRRARKRAS
jgi:predicted dehydrogenase